MELSKIVEQILKITNESPYGRLDMDSSEAGEIWKILNKELQQGQSLPIDSVSHCDDDTKDLIEHTKRVIDLIRDKSGIAVKVLGNRINKKLEQLK